MIGLSEVNAYKCRWLLAVPFARQHFDMRLINFHRSISPNTTSNEPMIALTSASMCFLPNGSSACSEANPGARILQR